jgi:apolipoprotein N-acyltransferase
VIALASALALALAHGTADLWPLAWLAPVPILWLANGDTSWRHVVLASIAAYLLGELGMLWPYLSAMGALVLVAALLPAVAFALIVLAARRAARPLPALAAALPFPALWTGWEWLSATLSPHGTFGSWAYSQVSAPVLIQGTSLLGPWIVSFLLAFVAAGLALAIRRRTFVALAPALALLAANAAFGAWRLHEPDGPTVVVAASARDHHDAATPDAVAGAEAAEVRRAAARGARVVVFDEKAARLPESRRHAVLAPLVAAARETGASIVAGFDVSGDERRNAAYAIAAPGVVQTYTKRHHIPGLEAGYTIGGGPGLLSAGEAVAICKDMDFQATLRDDARAGPREGGIGLMLVPAWDFGAAGWLHARMAILRGVENGFAVVRAASNGLLTVSDAQGRVIARAPSGTTGYASVVAAVPRGAGPTPYVRFGDAFAWVAGLTGVMLAMRPRRPTPAPPSRPP